jgi:hypothetical protein
MTEFKSLVTQYGGPEKVLSITFNNAFRLTMKKDEVFSFAEHLDEMHNVFVIKGVDPKGNPFVLVKPVEYVEGIIFAEKVSDIQNIDVRYISS